MEPDRALWTQLAGLQDAIKLIEGGVPMTAMERIIELERRVNALEQWLNSYPRPAYEYRKPDPLYVPAARPAADTATD
jgi:hypothetical protein